MDDRWKVCDGCGRKYLRLFWIGDGYYCRRCQSDIERARDY